MESFETEQVFSKPTLLVFFIVDVSASMKGIKMDTLNSSIEEFIPKLRDISECIDKNQIKVVTLAFSTEAHWIDSVPVKIEDYKWQYLEADATATDTIAFGEACDQLNEKLSRATLLTDRNGYYAPVIFLFTDRDLTDEHNKGFEKLKQNNWFKKAIKIAVAIGENANKKMLANFTGNKDFVITTHTPEALENQIKFIYFGPSQTKVVQHGNAENSEERLSISENQNENLSVGSIIRSIYGEPIEVVRVLSQGHNNVYLVNYNEKTMVLKWFIGKQCFNREYFYDYIKHITEIGVPTESFNWPLVITNNYEGSFGYLLKPIPSDYRDFPLFQLAIEKFTSIDAIINAALCIVSCFSELHRMGYSCQYMNDSNVIINPKTGDVLICDCDNYVPYGETLRIMCNHNYTAPEVLTQKTIPSIYSDRYSLAVLLYRLLFLAHPLEGKRVLKIPYLTQESEYIFYGSDPIFVWDPSNDTNRPVKGIHNNEIKFWSLYPEFIRNTFERAFSYEFMAGGDYTHRITEREWQQVFMALRGVTIKCPKCRHETFVDPIQPSSKCINCDYSIERYPVLKAKKVSVVLAPQQKVYACNVMRDKDDFRETVGVIVTSKTDPSILGLINLTDDTWVATLPDGATKSLAKGQVIRLGSGLKIAFDKESIGEII